MSVAIPQVQFWSKVVVLPVVVQRQVLMVLRHKRCHMCMMVGFVALLLSKLPTYTSHDLCRKSSSLRAFDGGSCVVCHTECIRAQGLASDLLRSASVAGRRQRKLGIESTCAVNVSCDVTLWCLKVVEGLNSSTTCSHMFQKIQIAKCAK